MYHASGGNIVMIFPDSQLTKVRVFIG